MVSHRPGGFPANEWSSKVKEVKKMVAQGDILLRKVTKLPKGATIEEPGVKGLVLAHSETGHDHVAVGPDVKLYRTKDPLTSYLEVQLSADIVHKRPFDTHETVRLTKGLWEVKRQREMTPEGWQAVQD